MSRPTTLGLCLLAVPAMSLLLLSPSGDGGGENAAPVPGCHLHGESFPLAGVHVPGPTFAPGSLQRERPQRPSRHLSGDPSGARLRGLLRVGRLPVQVLRAGRLQLHPQRHVGVQLLHHRRGGQGQSALGVSRGAQPRRLGDGDGQSLPLRHVPRVPLLSRRRTASALLAKPSPSKNVKYSRVKIGLSWRHGRWRTSNHLPGRRSAAGHEFALHAAPV
ncbi:glycoprotein hormone alpha-2 isoform X2 [Stigmatopora argus]